MFSQRSQQLKAVMAGDVADGSPSQCLSQPSPQACAAGAGGARGTIAAREEQRAVVDGTLLICAQHARHGLCSWDLATVRSVLLSRKAFGRGLATMVTRLVATRLAGLDALPALRDLTVTAAMEEHFGAERPPLLVQTLDQLAGLSALTRLCLNHTLVDDIRVLAGLPALRVLSLARNRGVSDLTPLSALRLEHLDLTGTGVADITPLAHMSSLEVLRLESCWRLRRLTPHLPRLRVLSLASASNCSDLTDVPGPALEELDLSYISVADITPLSTLSNLRVLSLDGTRTTLDVDKFAPLAALHNLHSLDLQSTAINHVAMLSGLMRLRVLNLSFTHVSDFAPLQQLQLEELDMHGITVEGPLDLAPLAAIHSLRRLDTYYCTELLNASVLSALTGLESLSMSREDALRSLAGTNAALTRLVVDGSVGDLSLCVNLAALQELVVNDCCSLAVITSLAALTCLRRLRLDCGSGDGISDLGPLRGLRLDYLECRSGHLTDLSPLTAMVSLTVLDCGGCSKLVNISPLAHLTRLHCLYLKGCLVTDIRALAQLPLQQLDLCETRVRDLSPLSTVHTLVYLDVSSTPAQDLSSLAGLMGLKLLATEDCMAVGQPSSTLVSLRGCTERVRMQAPCLDLVFNMITQRYWITAHGWVHRDLIAGCNMMADSHWFP